MRILVAAGILMFSVCALLADSVNPIGGNGIQSINGDSTVNQRFITSAAGTLFNITSNGAGLTTFQLPDAGAGISRGLVTNGTQVISGPKTFSSQITGVTSLNLAVNANLADVQSRAESFSNISPMTTTGDLIYATPTAARLAIGSSGNVLRVSAGIPAWSSTGSLTDTNTDGILIGGGTNALLGNVTISQHAASASYSGYLSSTDWSRFNSNSGGSGITALTGDGTASGTGSVPFTLATVNSNVGSFGSASAIPTLTVNGKGLVTAASTSSIVAPAGALTGTTLASNVVTSSLTSVGTVTSGVWSGTAVSAIKGGTAQTSYTKGDMLYSSAANTVNKLGIGTNGQVLTVDVTGVPAWKTGSSGSGITSINGDTTAAQTFITANAATASISTTSGVTTFYFPTGGGGGGSGTVTSVGLSAPSNTFMTVASTPVTTSGTIALNFNGTSGGVLGFTSPTTITSSALLAANQVVIGGGAGATPTTLAAGSQYQSLVMGASNPGYGAVNLAQSAAVTGNLPVTHLNSGTGATSSTFWRGDGTWAAAGTGSVSTVSVTSANGFAGTVSNPTTTPAITLSTSVNGILQGDGTGVSAASTTGSGSIVLSASPTLTGTTTLATVTAYAATVSGTLSAPGDIVHGSCYVTPKEKDLGNSGSAATIDLSSGNMFTMTMNSATPVITVSNPSPGCAYSIAVSQGIGPSVPSFIGTPIIWGNSGFSTFSTITNSVDQFSCVYNGASNKLMCNLSTAFQ